MYYNRNPWESEKEDCVCRSISAALNIEYAAVNNLLDLISEVNNCDKLCVCCYHRLLEGIFGLHPVNGRGRPVGDVAVDYSGKKLIIRTEGHLTCSMYGVVLDTWDCTEEIVDCFWVV